MSFTDLRCDVLIPVLVFVVAGDITQKGYEKKKARLLGPYVKQAHESKCRADSLVLVSLFVFLCVCVSVCVWWGGGGGGGA